MLLVLHTDVGRRPRLDLSCTAQFNTTTNKYDLIAEWTVPSFLVLEAIFNFRIELFRFPPGEALPAPGSQINFTFKSVSYYLYVPELYMSIQPHITNDNLILLELTLLASRIHFYFRPKSKFP